MYRIIIFVCLILTSCAKPIYIAAKCPVPNILPEPIYPIFELQKGDPAPKVIKAYVTTSAQCIGDDRMLRKKLEGYGHE